MLMTEIAARIPADAAQLAVARVIAPLGSEYDWGSDTLNDVATVVGHAHPVGVPSAFTQDDGAVKFRQKVRDR